jgi:hypothetical protein
MRLTSLMVICLLALPYIRAQEGIQITGIVVDSQDGNRALSNVLISLDGLQTLARTNEEGGFKFELPYSTKFVLQISLMDYVTKRIPIHLENEDVDLGIISLERDITLDQNDNLITLTDSELLDDEISSNSAGLLQATKDIFLNRAAFDFGQAFFRVRGYDSQYGKVFLNNIPMNKLHDGRPQWNNWGGLNDVTRNQQFRHGLRPLEFAFGGILGTVNIDTRPSGLRAGTRISSSISNRTYAGRLMATYTSGLKKDKIAYGISASRRWAQEGYIEGTLYDAFSFFASLEYKMNDQNSFLFTGVLASNRRGRSSAITEEVFNLVGKRYNPYWGYQEGKIRNSRERKISEPLLMLNHFYSSDKLELNTSIAYQSGINSRSRLGYYNAPNPDPTYYRYLPSFYINSSIGANFVSANTAREAFQNQHTLNWGNLYAANQSRSQNGKAAYLLFDDSIADAQWTLSTNGQLELNQNLELNFGAAQQGLNSHNYAQIQDLLGAEYHEDIDPFSNTLNDELGSFRKNEKDIFNYNYKVYASQFETFVQLKYAKKSWQTFLSGNFTKTKYQREGLFSNERFTSSIGKSKSIEFSNYGFKGGLDYKLTGRHSLILNGAILGRAPVLQNVFINPRENNQVVPNAQNEKISTVDFNYFLRLPHLTGRFTAYYTRFQNTTDVNFFFVDTGIGSDFVQEVVSNLDKLHQGLEIGLEYELSSTVKLSAVAAIGEQLYASDPNVSINFDTSGTEEDLINLDGNVNLGTSKVKGYRLAQGPQRAYALGINYRDPKYWWIGATANYMAENYANISTVLRTDSFYIDPETGNPFPDATEENVNKLLAQKPLDNFYLLNLVGGKSWLKKGKYISIFASVNNLFNETFRTGGYEQSRNGNFGQMQQDNLSGTPSFAPKYWYGYGRTYFLNLAYSF